MEFITDTCHLFLDADFEEATSRKFYSIDVFCNQKMVESIKNFSKGDEMFCTEFRLERIKRDIVFEKGIKTIKILFPWSVILTINEIRVDDGAMVKPAPEKDKMLFFGDSITHGYDAWYPSETYVYRVADRLEVDVYNKGIAGEVFFPELLEYEDDITPKYISVAYGTNDWNNCAPETFQDNCSRFYKMLAEKYPDVPIFAITPIWRKDKDEGRMIGDFKNIRDYIFEITDKYDNIHPIDGYQLVPHDAERYFSDCRLHPNSDGFQFYAENLFSSIKNCLL